MPQKQINIDTKNYLYDNKPLSINANLGKTFREQINSNDTSDKEIIVLDDLDKEYNLKVLYDRIKGNEA